MIFIRNAFTLQRLAIELQVYYVLRYLNVALTYTLLWPDVYS